ncbi:hypothetical protein JCM10207_008444 [Rhodosporidiobolus poonsookiae]
MPHALPSDDFALDPAPDFEERLKTLTAAVGRPLYQDLELSSDSDPDPQPDQQNRGEKGKGKVGRKAEDGTSRRATGGQVVDGLARDAASSKKRSRSAGDETSGRTSSSRPSATAKLPRPVAPEGLLVPPTPAPAATPAAAVDAMAVDPAPVPVKPSPSSADRVKPEPTPSPAKDPPPPARSPSPDAIEVLSSSEEPPQPKRHVKPRLSKVRAQSSKALLQAQASRSSAASAANLASTSKTGRSTRKKSRVSLEVEVANLLKLSGPKLAEEYKTISDLVDHLSPFTPASATAGRDGPLSGTRICFINTDHWRTSSRAVLPVASTSTSTPTGATRNRFDQGLRLVMGIAAKNGATLVKPEDFVPPPFDVDPDAPVNHEQAASEGWTTHIVPFVPEHQRQPTFAKILACLGPDEGGIARDELGSYVQVVKTEWVTKCAEARGRTLEWPFLVKGDWRDEERKERERARGEGVSAEQRRKEMGERLEAREREKKKKERKEAEKRKRQGARGRPEEQEDTEEEMDEDEDGGPPERISPFTEQDWPEGERPPTGYFDNHSSAGSSSLAALPSKRPCLATTSAAAISTTPPPTDSGPDEIVDPDLTVHQREAPSLSASRSIKANAGDFDDLKDQLALIEEHGIETVDFMLQVADEESSLAFNDDELKILTKRPMDDDETDEEREDDEARKNGWDVPSRAFNRWDRVPREKGSKYACDNPNRAKAVGPNEQTAKVLDEIAALQENGSFRQRGYKMAAGIMRNLATVSNKYQDLVRIRGIGDRLATKILEIQRSGTHRRVSLVTPRDVAASAFSKIYGIGAPLALDLFNRGARTLDDLRKNPDGFGLTNNQKIGLEFYDELNERIPRSEMDELFKVAKTVARKIDPKIELYCMGSYRRGEPTSGDIDILLTRNPGDGLDHTGYVRKLWKKLEEVGFAPHLLTQPNEWDALDAKVNGLCRLPKQGAKMRRIDILGVPWDELPAALIYFYFNRSLRLKARHLGYRLNQRGLYKDVARGRDGLKITEGTRVPGLHTEEALLKKLGVKWRMVFTGNSGWSLGTPVVLPGQSPAFNGSTGVGRPPLRRSSKSMPTSPTGGVTLALPPHGGRAVGGFSAQPMHHQAVDQASLERTLQCLRLQRDQRRAASPTFPSPAASRPASPAGSRSASPAQSRSSSRTRFTGRIELPLSGANPQADQQALVARVVELERAYQELAKSAGAGIPRPSTTAGLGRPPSRQQLMMTAASGAGIVRPASGMARY